MADNGRNYCHGKILLLIVTDKLSAMPVWHCAAFPLLHLAFEQPKRQATHRIDRLMISLDLSTISNRAATEVVLQR